MKIASIGYFRIIYVHIISYMISRHANYCEVFHANTERNWMRYFYFFVFLRFFGVKSWQRYQDIKVVFTRLEEFWEYLPAPAVTICPRISENIWKLMEKDITDPIGLWCGHWNDSNTFHCIQDFNCNITSTIRTVSHEYIPLDYPTVLKKILHWKIIVFHLKRLNMLCLRPL